MKDKNESLQIIIKELTEYSLTDQIGLIANILLILGLSHINKDIETDPTNIAKAIIDDRKENGETIYNAMALQGLTMVMWLENLK